MADAVVVAVAVMVELVEAWSFVVAEEVTAAVVAVVVERTDNRVERAY